MGKHIQKPGEPKPFNHVLEVQSGKIDIRDLFRRIDEKVKEKQEAQNGKNRT